MKKLGIYSLTFLGAVGIAPAFLACGPSDADMAALQRQLDAAKQEEQRKLLQAAQDAQSQHDADDRKYADAMSTNKGLQDRLQQFQDKLNGVQSGLASSQDEIKKLLLAKAEYEQRLKQLDDMRARFADLRSRLAKLTAQGLSVKTRNNRMVIQLPGSILFESGSDQLKASGKVVLKQVADIIRGDSTLSQRTFQVAGHTDNVEYGQGPFKDNWGLSLARARTVLVFLINPDVAPRYVQSGQVAPWGGNLDPHHWSAAGYGYMDPQSGTVDTQSSSDQALNRRVELVLEPNVEEMLNLSSVGDDPSSTPTTPGTPVSTTPTAVPTPVTTPPAPTASVPPAPSPT